LIDLFQEVIKDEYVLSEQAVNHIIENFLEKLPASYHKQLTKAQPDLNYS
jgi:hypothetical protein